MDLNTTVTMEIIDSLHKTISDNLKNEYIQEVEDAWFDLAYIVFTQAMYCPDYQEAKSLINEFAMFFSLYFHLHQDCIESLHKRFDKIQDLSKGDGYISSDQFSLHLFNIISLGPDRGLEEFKNMWESFNMRSNKISVNIEGKGNMTSIPLFNADKVPEC